jgi:hypothetical protein
LTGSGLLALEGCAARMDPPAPGLVDGGPAAAEDLTGAAEAPMLADIGRLAAGPGDETVTAD